MTRLRFALPLLATATLVTVIARPAAAEPTVTVSPSEVTISPDAGATVTIHATNYAGSTDVLFRFDPFMPTSMWTAARRTGDCNRSMDDQYACRGSGDVTITFPPVPSDATPGVYTLSAKVEGARWATVTVTVSAPPPPTTEPPTPTDPPSGEPNDPPTNEAITPPSESPSPDPSPSATPTPSATAEPSDSPTLEPTEQPAGGGLNMQAVGVFGTVGLVGIAAGVVGLLGWRRRRDGESEPPEETM